MFRRARESGPAVLVPLAWAVVAGAHLGAVSDHALFVAHVAMTILLAGFAMAGRADMRDGVLHVWWRIIAAGFVVTLVGTAGFLAGPAKILHGVALAGWIVLPAAGFVVTGRHVEAGAWIYAAGVAGCVLGGFLYAVGIFRAGDVGSVAGIVLVGLGQTLGILDAAIRY